MTDPSGADLEVPDDKVYLYERLGWDVTKAKTEPAKTATKARTTRRKEA